MVSPIPTSVKNIWEKWNLRGFVLLSLSLQTILILGAPFRKRSPSLFVTLVIWSSYLLADWAANFAIGLIANSQGDNPFIPNPNNTGHFNSDLLAFWAPFLLLHLGGPDTITAFALEDNTLWLRHLFGLVFQVIAAVYVFIQSFPKNKLWLPTVLLFLAGIIKYAERTRALYLASLDNFKESMIKKPDPGPNYAKLMEEYSSKKDAKLPTHIELTAERSKDSRTTTYVVDRGDMKHNIALVRHAFHFFNIFKGLIVDLIFSFHERFESRVFFHDRTAEDAFKLVAIELNFIYEALFTKVVVVHSKKGYICRAISFSAVCTALVCFQKIEKHDFHGFDVGITYILLFGALALDSIAVFMLIFSDWTVAAVKKSRQDSCLANILKRYITLKQSWWFVAENANPYLERCRQLLFRRWYESVSIFNLIHYSLKECPKSSPNIFDYFFMAYIEIIYLLGLKDLRDKIKYRKNKPLKKELWEFIFAQLKGKSMLADDPETARRISSARGDWILQDSDWNNSTDCRKLLPYVVDVEYDQSILLWHIATEFCYNEIKLEFKEDQTNKAVLTKIEHCKTLSEYMVYLLVMQPTMMSTVAGIGQIRFRDTCAEAKKFFSRRELGPDVDQKEACERILEVNTDVKPVAVKGDRSKSVLFDACILAKELKKMGTEKWDLMSQVWVELLAYAAGHCRANDHVQLLSKGGELVTFVWLVMAHFGIGEQFLINEGHARAKLIVGK
ncbi:hypothetical protein RchiOBHm_Chr5g0005741 [Rosa chinensis]|uniref:DUF4220 domain-containing protein n=1 Tax=Rosa chinensis TaxID=74649 RepID=A0A2P6Q3E5_ROSCH|nr:uncharacterized protein LOC112202314 [Rosa chinensis]PRQ28693.1 hypothetical protein RchiOBHm_Chr5g0005741 [Rosa chinensis]